MLVCNKSKMVLFLNYVHITPQCLLVFIVLFVHQYN